MRPNDSLQIATAALRWHKARAHRLVAEAEKRSADSACKAWWTGDAAESLIAGRRAACADAALAESRRQERAAVRALARTCAKAPDDMAAVEAFDAVLETRAAAMPTAPPSAHERATAHEQLAQPAPFPQTFPTGANVALV